MRPNLYRLLDFAIRSLLVTHPSRNTLKFPFLSNEQVQKLEQVVESEFFISPTQLANSSGYALAVWIRQAFSTKIRGMRILVVVGVGKNGGDGLIAASWLSTWGAQVAVATLRPVAEYPMNLSKYFSQFEKLESPFQYIREFNFAESAKESDLIVDCIFGTGLQSSPKDLFAQTIEEINASKIPVISADMPSGMGGSNTSSIVTASSTVCFGCLKHDFLYDGAMAHIGNLVLADIGIPVAAYRELGLDFPPVFLTSGFLKVDLGEFESIKKTQGLHS